MHKLLISVSDNLAYRLRVAIPSRLACSVEGAKALGIHFSLIRTATLYNLDPYKYYVTIFNAIPYCKTVADYEALLPWNIKLEKVKQAA